MQKSVWIPNSIGTLLEKEVLTVSTELITSITLALQQVSNRAKKTTTSSKRTLNESHDLFPVNRIKELHKVTVRIPPDNEKSNLIRIEGDPQGVQEAKKELLELASRMVGIGFLASMVSLSLWIALH